MKKRIIALVLVVCIILSLFVFTNVFAAEELLYQAPTKNIVNQYSFAEVKEDEIADGSITSQKGSVILSTNATETTGSLDASIDVDALKISTSQIEKQVPTTTIDILPNEINTDISKTVTSFKFKNTYTDAEGNPVTESKDSAGVCNIEFRAIGQDNDGTEVTQAGAFYNSGANWKVGARAQHGVSHHALGLGDIPAADQDGYYSLRIESYKNDEGIQYTNVYGEGCSLPIVKNVYCDNTSTAYADKLGYGVRLVVTFTGNDTNKVQTVWIKDTKIEYEISKGSVYSSLPDCMPIVVSNDGKISGTSRPCDGRAETSVVFEVERPIEAGNIVADLKIKKDAVKANDPFAEEIISQVMRSFQIAGKSTDDSENPVAVNQQIVRFDNDGKSVLAYDYSSEAYFTYSHSGADAGYSFDEFNEWASLRFVISRASVDDYWSIAMFDLDKSENVPVCTTYTYTDIDVIESLNYTIYAPATCRKATESDPSVPMVDLICNIKDVNMKITDDIKSSASYTQHRAVNPDTGNVDLGTRFWKQASSDPNYEGEKFVSWEGNIYINSSNNTTVLVALYDVDGVLVAIKMIDKNSGVLKNGFNKDVVIKISDLSSTWKLSKKLFIFDEVSDVSPLILPCEEIHPDSTLASSND